MVQLLIALALLFFAAPFVEEIKGGLLIVSGLLSLVLISAVLAVASRGRTLTIAVLLAIPAVAVTLPPSLMVELLVGTINIAAIAQEKKRGKRLEPLKYYRATESATIGRSMPLMHHQ